MTTVLACPRCQSTSLPEDRFCAACGYRLKVDSSTPLPLDPLFERLRIATAGAYDIHSELGRGGMAAVYLAYDLRLHRKVAIKVMLPELMSSPGMADRFLLEARTAARLSHPNIVVIHSVSQATELSYFVMALVEGATLEDLLHAEQTDSLAIASWVVSQAARALAHAHGEGVVHRDVKPANILVNSRGDVFLTDFGIAKASQAQAITRTGAAVGTPSYMSPEQVMADEITGAADQYALGVVAYELLSGQQPFRGSVYEVQWAHVHRAPRPLSELAPGLPSEIAEGVMRMLAKRPADRWPSLEPIAELFQQSLPKGGAAPRAELARRAGALQSARSATRVPTPRSPVPATLDRSRERPAHSVAPPQAPTPADVPPQIATSAIEDPPHRLVLGETLDLDIEADTDGTVSRVDATVRFESTDPSVIQVDALGVVTAVGLGDAAVVILADDSILRVKFSVVAAPVMATLRLVPESLELEPGDSERLRVELQREGDALHDDRVVWLSRDSAIATVGPDGTVLAHGAGVTQVEARCGASSSTATVRVVPAIVAGLVITPSPLRLTARGTAVLRVESRDRRERRLADRPVSFAVARADVVKVDRTGAVTALAPGETTITVSCEGVTARVDVIVEAAAVAEIVVTPSALRLDRGEQQRLTTRLSDAAGVALEGRSVRWSIDDARVATVDGSGLVTAIGEGTTAIRASSGAASATARVDVVAPAVVQLLADVRSMRLQRGRRQAVRLRAVDAKGRAVEVAHASLQSADPTIARVEHGEVVGVGEGTTRVTARLGDVHCDVEVRVEPIDVARVVADAPPAIAVGRSRALAATAYASDEERIADARVEWHSDDPSIAIVSADGVVRGIAIGTTRLTATCGAQRTVVPVRVVAAQSRMPLLAGAGAIAAVLAAVMLWQTVGEDEPTGTPAQAQAQAPVAASDSSSLAGSVSPTPEPPPTRAEPAPVPPVAVATRPDSVLTIAQLPVLTVNDTTALTVRIDGRSVPASRVRVTSRNPGQIAVIGGRLVARGSGVARLDVAVGSQQAVLSVAVRDRVATSGSQGTSVSATPTGNATLDASVRPSAPSAPPVARETEDKATAGAPPNSADATEAAPFALEHVTAVARAVVASLDAASHAEIRLFHARGDQHRMEVNPAVSPSLDGDRARISVLLTRTVHGGGINKFAAPVTFRLVRSGARIEFRDVVVGKASAAR